MPVRKIEIVITGDLQAAPALQALNKHLGETQGKADQASVALAKTGSGMGSLVENASKLGLATIGIVGLAGAAAILVGGLSGAVGAASNMNETLSKSSVVFGDASGAVAKFGSTAARAMGMSKQQAVEATATMGNLFIGMGMARGAAADMSMGMVKLAADLASVNNIPTADGLEKIRAGLIGESEPLRSVGVLLTEEAVKLEAVRMGLAKVGQDLTEGQKVQARYNLILAQTTTAQGDFARTSDGMANSTRIIQASFEDLQVQIGQQLLPILAPLIADFAKNLPGAIESARPFMEAFGKAAMFVGDALGYIGGVSGAAAAGIANAGAAAANAATPMGTYASLLRSTNEQLGEMYRLEGLNAAAQGRAAREGPLWWTRGAMPGPEAYVEQGYPTATVREYAEAVDAADAAEGRRARDLQVSSNRAAEFKGWLAAISDESEIGHENLKIYGDRFDQWGLKAAKAGAKAGDAAAKAAEKLADAAREIARDMDSEVGAALIRINDLEQDYGDRWITRHEEVAQAISDAYAAAARAIQELGQQEILSESISARRRNLEDRLSFEARGFSEAQKDQQYHWQEERELVKLTADEQRDLSKAKTAEDKRDIQQRYGEEVAALRQKHIEFDLETRFRLRQEDALAAFQKRQETERAALEKALRQEELDRQRAAIEADAAAKIEKLNIEWAEWQRIEREKTDRAKLEESARATAKLTAWRDDFINKLEGESAPGIGNFASMVGAKLAEALAAVAVPGLPSRDGGGDEGGIQMPATITNLVPAEPGYTGPILPGTYRSTPVEPVITPGIVVNSYSLSSSPSQIIAEAARILKPELDRITGAAW